VINDTATDKDTGIGKISEKYYKKVRSKGMNMYTYKDCSN
jgi:hypothetical protein